MKGRKRRRRHHGHYSGPPDGTAEDVAAQLAPAEERGAKSGAPPGAQNNGGAIVVGAGAPALPGGFGAARKRSRLFEDRVVLVIVALMLLFTAFIAWRVSKMRDEPQPVRVMQE